VYEITITFNKGGLSRKADDKSIFHGNDLAGGALVATVATKAKKKRSE